MGWFTDTTNCPKIVTAGYRYRQTMPFTIVGDSASPRGYHREIQDRQYEFRGLTFAAADSIAAAKKNASVDSHTIDAAYFRENDAGAYGVRIAEHIRSAWVADS